MKAIKILSHPHILIVSFLLVLISGEHFGGFYLLYLMLGLPHWGLHSIAAFLGIALLVFSYMKYKGRGVFLIAPVLNMIGSLLLIASLFLFFYNDREHYNYGTFYQVVPMVMLVVFSLLSVAFLVDNVIDLTSKNLKGNTTY